MQRKFRRKPKQTMRPTPVIQFKNYLGAMTPLERYRKHYLMFEYWNAGLLDALTDSTVNSKRIRHMSSESLTELDEMRNLIAVPLEEDLEAVITERTTIDRELQAGRFTTSRLSLLKRRLDLQTRHFHRNFFWRDVEDNLKQEP